MSFDVRDLCLRTEYWGDPPAKSAFLDLVGAVFGLELGPWDAAGFWDDAYQPFTYFDPAGRAVSSVCLYAVVLCVDGRRCTVGQLSAVATRPEWRRRGLARRLAGEALQVSSASGHPFCYLFADDDALPLYRSLGFDPMPEAVTVIDGVTAVRREGAHLLDMARADDLAHVHGWAVARAPASLRLGAWHTKLLMFHVLGGLRRDVWWIEPLQVVVLARRRGHELTLFDVVGKAIPTLDAIIPFLAQPGDERIVVRFEADQLGDLQRLGRVSMRPLLGNNLHVRGAFPCRAPCVFPLTAQA